MGKIIKDSNGLIVEPGDMVVGIWFGDGVWRSGTLDICYGWDHDGCRYDMELAHEFYKRCD